MNWARIIGWSLVVFGAANVIGLLSGLIIGHSKIGPATIDQLLATHRLIRRIAVAVVSVICYWRLGAGALRLRAAHIASAFLLIQLAELCLSFLLGTRGTDLVEPWALLRAFAYAIVGYGLARLRPNNSFKPKPLRGSA